MQKLLNAMVQSAGGVLAVLGAALAAGGLWLIWLGGSWFYLPAGVLLAATGIHLLRLRAAALWTALSLLAMAGVWALWEAGLEFWQLVPRLITFLVVALLASAAAPLLRRGRHARALRRTPAAALCLLFAMALATFFAGMLRPHPQVVADGTAAPVRHPQAGLDAGADWPAYGRTTRGNRYVPFEQINTANVQHLQVAWMYRTGDLAVDGAEYQATPLKIGDTVYLCTPLSKVIALDATTGTERWRFDPKVVITPSTRNWKRCRGLGYAELGPAQPGAVAPQHCRRRIIETTIDARLLALDADTGQPCKAFGNGGQVDLGIGIAPAPPAGDAGTYNVTSAPLVADGVVMVGGRLNDNLIVGEPGGVVRGYDVVTGALRWAWDAKRGARDSSPLPEGELYPLETPNFWGTAAYDPVLGLAYFPLGNQTPDFWTGNRHPYSNEYNAALVAVDLQTGKERWHFRTVNIDAFDYDVSAQPILYDMPDRHGRIIPVVVQLTKRGQIFVLDRRTGEPVVPVQQRRVSTDVMPGMQVAPTQPYSAIAVGTEPLKESDMWGVSIFDQLYCRIQFKQMRWEGEFTPLSDQRRTLIYPGYYGGFNWGGGALDARSGTLIVNDIRMAQWGRFIRHEDALRSGLKVSTEGEYSRQAGTPWGVQRSMFVSPLGVPCFKPPFGTLTALELPSGKVRWQVPLGTIQDAPVLGIAPGVDIPVGMPTMGGPLVTGGGLTFFHGTLDYYVRAFDNRAGEERWRGRLPVGGQGAPMSYLGKDGRQYVVVVAGGATRTGSNRNRGDYVIAYALPWERR